MSGPFDLSAEFGQTEHYLWDDTFGDFHDPVAQALFHEAYFVRGSHFSPEELSAIRDNLSAYLQDEYGFDFDQYFDWDTWRDVYENQ
jgi:hypothetical protein